MVQKFKSPERQFFLMFLPGLQNQIAVELTTIAATYKIHRLLKIDISGVENDKQMPINA
jgi:hypothetical protein